MLLTGVGLWRRKRSRRRQQSAPARRITATHQSQDSESRPCDGAEEPTDPGLVSGDESLGEDDAPVVRVHLALDEAAEPLGQLLR